MKPVVPFGRREIREIGVAEHQITIVHEVNAIATDVQVPGAAHLPGELQAVARHPRNVR